MQKCCNICEQRYTRSSSLSSLTPMIMNLTVSSL